MHDGDKKFGVCPAGGRGLPCIPLVPLFPAPDEIHRPQFPRADPLPPSGSEVDDIAQGRLKQLGFSINR